MTELKDWITELKIAQPELSDFITRLERFISETGFNNAGLEKAVETGLQRKEEEVKKLLKTNAEN